MGRKKAELTEAQEAELRRMAQSDGYGTARIAKRLGMTENVLLRIAREKGIEIKQRSNWS
jgi:DNA-binding CsgD family transcriptional regulator